jgi:predicted NBD/HSP70 family sugar kinase
LASVATLEKAIDADGNDSSALWAGDKQWDSESPVVRQWIQQAAHGIAHAVASSISVIDFEACVIDGSLPNNIRSKLVNLIRHHLQDMQLTGLKVPQIFEGSIGANARVLGAASLPLSERFLVDQNAFLQQ